MSSSVTLMSAMFMGVWSGSAQAADQARSEVVETLRAWTAGTDARDADAVARVFHPEAVQVVTLGETEMTLGTDAYLGMIRDGKIGGGRTDLTIHSIFVRDHQATAIITRSSSAMEMDDAVVLERATDGWRIAGASIRATPRP